MKVEASAKPKTLGDAASLAIEKYFHKIVTHELEVLKDRDPEELHQMRVGMRRLRSAVTGFGPVLDLPKEAAERKIAKVARVLGTLRDLDVMQESLQKRYQPTLPSDEQDVLDKALMEILKRRHRAFKGVREILESKHYQLLKQGIRHWLEKPQYQAIAQLPIEEILPDLLLPQVSQLFLHPAWLIGASLGETDSPQEITPETVEKLLAEQGLLLHELRKQAKRIRYLMNLFADFYGTTYEAYVEDMKALQECLGDIQDSVVLDEFLEDIFEFDIKKNLPHLAEQLAESRYQAWLKWQTLQRRYLNAQIRHGFREELLRPRVDKSSLGESHC